MNFPIVICGHTKSADFIDKAITVNYKCLEVIIVDI